MHAAFQVFYKSVLNIFSNMRSAIYMNGDRFAESEFQSEKELEKIEDSV